MRRLIACLLFVSPVVAQTRVSLHGTVVDTNGRVLTGKPVRIDGANGKLITETMTDEAGVFTFSGPPADYIVRIRYDTEYGPAGIGTIGRTSFDADNRPSFVVGLLPECGPCISEQPPVATESAATSGTMGGAQGSGASSATGSRAGWNFGGVVQSGVGVTQDRSSYKFLMIGGHAGKVLTPEIGSGVLRGDFEYGVEVFPLWQSYTPRFQKVSCSADPGAATQSYTCSAPYTVGGTFTGVSVTPIILRWNLTHGERWMPWVQGAGGMVWTNHKYPAIGDTSATDLASNGPHGDTSVWNFTPQFGVGVHYFVRPRRSIDVGANAVHVSSASLGDKNPGVNASVQFSVGYSWWK